MDFPGKNTEGGRPLLLQGIFPNQGSNLRLLPWEEASLAPSPREARIHLTRWETVSGAAAGRMGSAGSVRTRITRMWDGWSLEGGGGVRRGHCAGSPYCMYGRNQHSILKQLSSK